MKRKQKKESKWTQTPDKVQKPTTVLDLSGAISSAGFFEQLLKDASSVSDQPPDKVRADELTPVDERWKTLKYTTIKHDTMADTLNAMLTGLLLRNEKQDADIAEMRTELHQHIEYMTGLIVRADGGPVPSLCERIKRFFRGTK